MSSLVPRIGAEKGVVYAENWCQEWCDLCQDWLLKIGAENGVVCAENWCQEWMCGCCSLDCVENVGQELVFGCVPSLGAFYTHILVYKYLGDGLIAWKIYVLNSEHYIISAMFELSPTHTCRGWGDMVCHSSHASCDVCTQGCPELTQFTFWTPYVGGYIGMILKVETPHGPQFKLGLV